MYFLREPNSLFIPTVILVTAILGAGFSSDAAELRNNQLMIGTNVIGGLVTNGKIVADHVTYCKSLQFK